MANLIEVIQPECNRLREQVLPEYEKLPNGVGMVAATFMKNSIRKAEASIASGEVVEMVTALNDLKGYSL
jgi:hypothetical protein